MELVDSHGHLNFAAFTETWEAAADRARDRGVVAIVLPGSQYPTSQRAIDLARQRPGFLFAAVGLHPTHIAPQRNVGDQKIEISNQENEKYEDFDAGRYLALARQPEVVAIGEVGLDTYRVQLATDNSQLTSGLTEQERIFKEFIRIAQAVGKPMIVHCRGSKKPGDRLPTTDDGFQLDPHERLITLLGAIPQDNRPKFVIHCYQGTAEQAARYLALGGLISLTGTITYSDDSAVTDVVRSVPPDRLMIETDSPYLSPVPYRGESNEPWKVVEVARRVAELQGVSLEAVAEQTTLTARRFFSLS